MSTNRVSISVEGTVMVDADVSRAKSKIDALREGTIGSGAPVPPPTPPASAAPTPPAPAPTAAPTPPAAPNPTPPAPAPSAAPAAAPPTPPNPTPPAPSPSPAPPAPPAASPGASAPPTPAPSGAPAAPPGTPTPPSPTPPTPPGAPAAPNPLGGLNAAYFQGLAERALASILPRMGQLRTDNDFDKMGRRIEIALWNAEQAKNDDLVDTLTELREELRRNRAEAAQNRANAATGQGGSGGFGGGPGAPPAPGAPGGGGWWQSAQAWLTRQAGNSALGGLTGVLGGPVGTAAFGGLAKFLTGPAGLLLGGLSAANWAFNAVSNKVTQSNAPARQEIMGMADLARQYGSDQDFMKLYRTDIGRTEERFRQLGYTATQAAHVTAIYDRPLGTFAYNGAGNDAAFEKAVGGGGVASKTALLGGGSSRDVSLSEKAALNDTTAILAFARTLGMDETRVAGAARQMSIAGVGGTGPNTNRASEALVVMKKAVSEGLRDGISQSETMNVLAGFAQRAQQNGVSTNNTAIAYLSMVMKRLNSSDNAAMRGEAGARVATGFLDGVANSGGDQGLDFMISRTLIGQDGKLPTAKSLGITEENEAKGYDMLAAQSPLMAVKYLRERIGEGKNPEILANLMARLDEQVKDPATKYMFYRALNPKASEAQILDTMGGGGVTEVFRNDPQALQRWKNGEGLMMDNQGKNALAGVSLGLQTDEADRTIIKSLAGLLTVLGDLERFFSNAKNFFADAQGLLAQNFRTNENPTGSLRGRAMTGAIDPTFAASYDQSRRQAVPGGTTAQQDAAPQAGVVPRSSGLTGMARILAANAMTESTNGANPRMNAGDATGLYQVLGSNMVGPNNWAKMELGIDPKNPDGTPVSTPAQGKAWLRAHPKEADAIGAAHLTRTAKMVEAAYQKQGTPLNASQVAGMTNLLWHRNGGASVAPLRGQDGRLITDYRRLSREANVDGVSDYDAYVKTQAHFLDPNLRPPASGPGSQPAPAPNPPAKVPPAASNVAPATTAEMRNLLQAMGGRDKKTKKPTPYTVTQQYGNGDHGGIDVVYAGGKNAPIFAPYGGTVEEAGEKAGGYGIMVRLRGQSGYSILYEHLSSVAVKPGDKITAGTLLGYQGNTGNVRSGNGGDGTHLHFEVQDPRGRPVNPKSVVGGWERAWAQNKPGFQTGGWTGAGPQHDIAGVVHFEEVVMNQRASRLHRPLLERLNAGGTVEGGATNVNVNVGGVLRVEGDALSRGAHDEIQRAGEGFRVQVQGIVARDLRSRAGVR